MSLFKILGDVVANTAHALSRVITGQTIDAGLNGILAFVFRISDGNATTVQLNPDGTVPTAQDSGSTIRDSQVLAEGSQTKDVEAEVLALDLVLEKVYTKQNAMVSCFRASLFRMVYVDDYGVENVEQQLGYALVDAGNINEKIKLAIDEFDTIGGTGVQKLVIYHTPLDKESDALVSASVNEAP